jgi:arginase
MAQDNPSAGATLSPSAGGKRRVAITNVHLDLGSGRRGTDMGPSAIHVAGLVPELEKLGCEVTRVRSVGSVSFEASEVGDPTARFLGPVGAACARVADEVVRDLEMGLFPLVLGGDHSQAIGTIAGLARFHRAKGRRIGVIWVDAHTDINTPETSPTGNIHGMPLAVLLGHGHPELVALCGEQPALDPRDVVVIGARDLDDGERRLIRELGVRVYTMAELDERGTAVCVREAFDRVQHGTAGVHLSFDLDGVDPSAAPGVGTPVPGGLSIRESHLICETAARTGRLLGMEMVELNPTLDLSNQTGRLAVWLISSALGKTIL